MKPLKLLLAVAPVALGIAAANWTTLSLWYDMKEGLIAFLGFLAAALVQVMPVTANFLQSDRLNPAEATRLTASLTKQQHYWIGLLTATIIALVIVIVGAALKDRVTDLQPVFRHQAFMEISWPAVVCFCIVASVSFVLIKMLGLFEGMLALHRLRGELVLNAAKRDAAEKAESAQRAADITTPFIPENYGRIIRPH